MLEKILSTKKAKIITALTLIISLTLTIVSILIPNSDKSAMMGEIGREGALVGESTALTLSQYAVLDIEELKSTDYASTAYRDLSGLLYNIARKTDTSRIYILHKAEDNKYYYLADSAYNAAIPSSDYAMVGQAVENEKLHAKSSLDKMLTEDLVSSINNDASLIMSYCTIYDNDETPTAIIAVEQEFTDNTYSKIGFISWNSILIVSLSLLVLSSLSLSYMLKYRKKSKIIEEIFEEEEKA